MQLPQPHAEDISHRDYHGATICKPPVSSSHVNFFILTTYNRLSMLLLQQQHVLCQYARRPVDAVILLARICAVAMAAVVGFFSLPVLMLFLQGTHIELVLE